MTRIKTILKNVEILDVRKVKSKRGNNYQVLTVKDNEGKEVKLYDPNVSEVELNKFYDFDLEVIISSYPSIKILKVYPITEEKKGFFR